MINNQLAQVGDKPPTRSQEASFVKTSGAFLLTKSMEIKKNINKITSRITPEYGLEMRNLWCTKQILEPLFGRIIGEREIVEANFNLVGFAKTLLKMQMEQKYGKVAN